MSAIESWKAFIKAQEIFINQYAEPFQIVFKKSEKDGNTHFEIIPKHPFSRFWPTLKNGFIGIEESDVYLKEGYILYDADKSPKNAEMLREGAAANYFDIDLKACFSGYFLSTGKPYDWIFRILGSEKTGSPDHFFATFDQIQQIDNELSERPEFRRIPTIGAILKVRPDNHYLDRQFNIVSNYLNIEYIKLNEQEEELIIENTLLSSSALVFIKEHSAFQKSYHRITIIVENIAFDHFLATRNDRKIFFKSEDNNSTLGVILPDPENNQFQYFFSGELPLHELKIKFRNFYQIFTRYFGKQTLTFKHEHIFHLDRSHFFAHLKQSIVDERFSISEEKEIISFDFSSRAELKKNIHDLDHLNIDYRGDSAHRFKIKILHTSPLLAIQEKLNKIPAIRTKMRNDGSRLSFFCAFEQNDITDLLVAKIHNVVTEFPEKGIILKFDELQTGKLKYYLHFREEDYLSEVKNKFNAILGENISILRGKHFEVFGIVKKLNYPFILVDVQEKEEEVCINDKIHTVSCTLKGELDKIKRLSDTVTKIFSGDQRGIANIKLSSILMTPETAETIDGDILFTSKYQKEKANVENSLLSKHINERQKEAITKSLLAKDFFIIQGPPGTGKSTAIAELIWQHIRVNLSSKKNNYRILVTSETNLAVDNALDKLKSQNHLLIKPLRFGSDDKLEKEGRRFSLEAIKKWAEERDEHESNILQDWINLIISRVKAEMINNGWQPRWVRYIQSPTVNVRKQFLETYLKYANVIGATCSSIGKENSQKKFTRFFADYINVAYPSEYKTFRSSVSKRIVEELKKKDIVFDLVVQDEASKASPPELALPCLFGKKAVIIGDHRQLPPMVDTNEFIEQLSMMEKKETNEKKRREIIDLVKYVKMNRGDFTISHFERLFKGIHSNLKSSFNVQYRMHPAINETIKQFYLEDGGLECGIPPDIANSTDMSHPLNRFHGITNNKNIHVIWLDVNTPELKVNTSRVNYGEISAIEWLLGAFEKSPGYQKFVNFWPENEIEQKQIGIITFYGAQASLINKLKEKYPQMPLRISPVDRFQGMERNIVIVSLVRSNSLATYPDQPPERGNPLLNEDGYIKQESLGFAELPNRLNVALSRAKRLLIVVGNAKHFSKHPIYKKVYETIQHHPNGVVKSFDPLSTEQ